MPIVRIVAKNHVDRLKSLPMGISRFGSDFSCDVVLIDENIYPEHFTLQIDEDGVFIQVHPDAEAALLDPEGNQHLLIGDGPHVWSARQHLVTAGIEVYLGGAPVKLPISKPPKSALPVDRRRRLYISAALVTITFVGISQLNNGAWLRESSAAFGAVPQYPVVPSLPVTDIRTLLQQKGLTPHRLNTNGEVPEAIFYLDNVAARDAASATLATLGMPIRAHFHLRSQLLSAIRIILEATEGRAKLVSLQDGHVELGGLEKNDELRSILHSRILSDVPGISSVQFVDPIGVAAEELTHVIAAVWFGERPYVMLKNGQIVRLGQLITPDTALIDILSGNRISVRVNDRIQEVSVK